MVSRKNVVMLVIYSTIAMYTYYIYNKLDTITVDEDFFETAHSCVEKSLKNLEDKVIWERFPNVVNQCSVEKQNVLNVKSFANTDELKYHVMPLALNFDDECTIISLGIGKDVDAEKAMKAELHHCLFYGADPVNDTNADIFPEVGRFYNIAVGAENGSFRSYILEDIYRYQEVKYTDIATFIRKYVRRNVIDQMMVDIEHAEYPMLPFLLQSGQLNKDGVTVCQLNIEIHRPNAKQRSQFASFYRSIMEENQWTFMSTSMIIGHMRLFMINHGSSECRRRYLNAS